MQRYPIFSVAEFAQRISSAHEQFALQIQNIVDVFRKRNQELTKESTLMSGSGRRRGFSIRRPGEYQSTLSIAWEALLHETQADAQTHADTANLLIKNVCNPLLDIGTYKKSQSKKLFTFRESFESLLTAGENDLHKYHTAYVDAYQLYRSNLNTRDSAKFTSAYNNAHNEYILQLKMTNCLEDEYHQTALPYLLEELEEIHIDLANTLNGAIESHALLILTKAADQSKRFEGILKICNKEVNPKTDVHNFLSTLSEKMVPYQAKRYAYVPPDPNISTTEFNKNVEGFWQNPDILVNNQVGVHKQQVVIDRFTETNVANKRQQLQKEAMELTSYIKQNQDVTHTLMNVCQR
ncbi:hypothetical protein LSH36_1043g00005 [Paralvinella palmiformis]|uniref:Uncharacterized protein n=1 Tax=Paralvinella palmiformis TaxID=53620 RepID=A0AAD9MQJ9_9ANNE|nr:hypothetical protein LSH36_1043g00005 [Paralvinella palmiformis]